MVRGIRVMIVVGFGLLLPILARAATYDVQIQRSDVTFRPERFFVGDLVRVYATVKNIGEKDVQGNVFFSENGAAIGTPPPFSVRAQSVEEEVWVDWQPAVVGDRQIFVRVVTAPETRDENTANNEMIVPVTVDRDTDGDRIGDREDADDDGDGLPDAWEAQHGLNPIDASDALGDPDGDGVRTIDEYRAGTDPFRRALPATSSQPQPDRGAVVPSGASAPAVPLIGVGEPFAPVLTPAPRPHLATRPSGTRAPTAATRPLVESPPAASLPATTDASFSTQLASLLGGPAPRRWPTRALVAAAVALIAAVAIAVLRVLRRRRAPPP